MPSKTSKWLMRWFEEPRTRGMDLDGIETSIRRHELSKNKLALNLSYINWYRKLAEIDKTAPSGLRVELGSGGGFLEEFIPGLVTTDVLPLPFVDKVCSAEELPFENGTVAAIYMINVLHHVADVERFFAEAQRVLVAGGLVAMIEPYVSPFSKFIWSLVHHEPFDMTTQSWRLAPSGPLSGGNDALPWIIFVRDRFIYDARYPDLRVERIVPHTFLSHLLSGGVTMRSFVSPFVIRFCQKMEELLGPILLYVGVFGTIVLQKKR